MDWGRDGHGSLYLVHWEIKMKWMASSVVSCFGKVSKFIVYILICLGLDILVSKQLHEVGLLCASVFLLVI